MDERSAGTMVGLRAAGAGDCRNVWSWRNDPGTRAWSLNAEPLPYEPHVRWFTAALSDPSIRIFVVHDADEGDIGYVRFRIDGDVADVSIGLAPAARGRGYGTAALERAAERLFAEGRVRGLRALVLPGNAASARAFERAGFTLQPQPVTVDGVTVHELLRWERA